MSTTITRTGNNRSWARKRHGPNWKNDCCFCGKPIANRMLYDSKEGTAERDQPTRYAHTRCAKGQIGNWEPAW